MVVVCSRLRSGCGHHQWNYDHYHNMRNNIDTQPLAAELGRFRPVFSYEEKFKRFEDEEEEYIDVIGEYPSSEPEPEVLHPKAQQSLLEQPPSKIYYDNIEKESSDGGFFDRDDLEDEDERNELVIDCKLLNGGNGESTDPKKKTESVRTSGSQEPEVVFNFTLVDTQLVYNESKLVRKDDRPVISVSIPPPAAPRHSMLQHQLQHGHQPQPQQQQRVSSQLRNMRELRTATTRPYSKLMPNDPRRTSRSYRAVMTSSSVPVKRALSQSVGEPIGSRLRTSAFAPPPKSHYTTQQSVQQLPATANRRPMPSYPQPGLEKLPKKPVDPSIPYSSPNHHQQHQQPHPRAYTKSVPRREAPPPSPERCKPRTVTYLPVQFGFGSSVLHNLYDEHQPLDFSKNSPLWQYESMLKCPRDQQLRQGYHILNSMPIPKPPKPPPRAIRPKLVPMKRHPTLSLLRRPPAMPRLKIPPPPPPVTTVIDLVSPNPPTTTPAPKPGESFRSAMRTQIDAFFVQRQKEICDALRNYSDELIDQDRLFALLEQLEIRYNRDYLGLAGIMIKQYGCRFRATLQMDYKWNERPQDFVEYFGNIRRQNDLQPGATEATLDIYRMVVGGLLEQFRASMEHFLSSNLVAAAASSK